MEWEWEWERVNRDSGSNMVDQICPCTLAQSALRALYPVSSYLPAKERHSRRVSIGSSAAEPGVKWWNYPIGELKPTPPTLVLQRVEVEYVTRSARRPSG